VRAVGFDDKEGTVGVETLKDCPSCGSRIAASSVQCSSCNSKLGRCVGCDAWIVEATQCMDCGKSTVARASKFALAADENKITKCRLDAVSAVELLPILGLRMALAIIGVTTIVAALAASPFGKVSAFVVQHGVKVLEVKWTTLWGAAGVLLILVFLTGSLLRRIRWRHMVLLEQPVEVRLGVGGILLNLLLTVVGLGLTAGLGLPWLYARYRRSFYRDCRLQDRDDAKLDFRGTGAEVLGHFCLTLLLIPFVIASAGLMWGVIAWMWVKWDHDNIRVPDKNGRMRTLRLKRGMFTPYYGRWLLGWILTLATAGIYRPWAKVAEWRWIADNTEIT
jgi:hypothetical protein